MAISDQTFFCSWSGGKDSCLALYRALKSGGIPKALLTMFTEEKGRSRSHGLPLLVLERQAQALKLPLVTRAASWGDYEAQFIEALSELKTNGVTAGVFGDIDLQAHRDWVESVCSRTEIEAFLPLWLEDRKKLVLEFIRAGFEAVIIAVNEKVLAPDYLGRPLTKELIKEFEELGVDPAGEGGEFHTVVYQGPIFENSIDLKFGERLLKDGYWFIDVSVG